jgi:hypothetical protein
MGLAVVALLCVLAYGDASASTRVPNRQSGDEATTPSVDVSVDAATQRVTRRMAADDIAGGGVLSTVRREQLQVFEDGVRQQDVAVDIEHLPVSVNVLIEMGGRSRELAEVLQDEAPHLIRPLLDRLGPADSLSLFAYDRTLRTAIDPSAPRTAWKSALDGLTAPTFSEANFYDAIVDVLDRTRSSPGRRAIVVITTGIDTFSRTTFDELLARVRDAQIPIYCLSLADIARSRTLNTKIGPLSRVNWNRVDDQCARLSAMSGGRMYREVGALTTPAIFDDILERLRVRYVLSYVLPAAAQRGASHAVEIRVAESGDDRQRGERPLARRTARGRVVAAARYTIPATASRHRPERRDKTS